VSETGSKISSNRYFLFGSLSFNCERTPIGTYKTACKRGLPSIPQQSSEQSLGQRRCFQSVVRAIL
jgi:hypothetical protein